MAAGENPIAPRSDLRSSAGYMQHSRLDSTKTHSIRSLRVGPGDEGNSGVRRTSAVNQKKGSGA